MTNEKAINQLKDMQSRCQNGYDAEAINIAIEALENRSTGEWTFYEGVTTQGFLRCSVCGWANFSKKYFNYCPNCGAKMKGEAEK